MKFLKLGLLALVFISASALAGVNINQADKAELTTLSGIGDVKAEAIIAYRDAHGDFTRAEQLLEVDGIGQKTFDRLAEDVQLED